MRQVLDLLTPHDLRFIWIGIGTLCVAALGLGLWPKRQETAKSKSAFIESDGDGQFELADVETSADTFMQVKGSPSVAAKRVRHDPARAGKQPVPK